MPSHENQEIKRHIASSDELVQKMTELQKTLSRELHEGFEQDMGIPIPSVMEAEVRSFDFAMKYSTELNIQEFTSGALTIASAALSGNKADIANKAVQVAATAINKIFQKDGSVQIGVHGDSAKIPYNDQIYIAATYASSAFCKSTQWATSTDFYVSNYVFVVFEVFSPRARGLLSIRAA